MNLFQRFWNNLRIRRSMRKHDAARGAVKGGDLFTQPPTFAELLARAKRRAAHQAAASRSSDARDHAKEEPEECEQCATVVMACDDLHDDVAVRWWVSGSCVLWCSIVAGASLQSLVPCIVGGIFAFFSLLLGARWREAYSATASDAHEIGGEGIGYILLSVPFSIAHSAWHYLLLHPLRAIRRWWRRTFRETCTECAGWERAGSRLKIALMSAVASAGGVGAGLLLYRAWPESPRPWFIDTFGSMSALVFLIGALAAVIFGLVGAYSTAQRVFHRHREEEGGHNLIAFRMPVLAESTDVSPRDERELLRQYIVDEITTERERLCGNHSACIRAHARLRQERVKNIAPLIRQGQARMRAERDAGREPRAVVLQTLERLQGRDRELTDRMRQIEAFVAAVHSQFDECFRLVDRVIAPMDDRVFVANATAALANADELLAEVNRVMEDEMRAFCERVVQIRAALVGALQDAEFDTALAVATGEASEIAALEEAATRLRIPERIADTTSETPRAQTQPVAQ